MERNTRPTCACNPDRMIVKSGDLMSSGSHINAVVNQFEREEKEAVEAACAESTVSLDL